jgi:hypothetical protein
MGRNPASGHIKTMIASKSRDKKEEISMSTKVITVWLILLTAWVGLNYITQDTNRQERNLGVQIRNQKFENIDANLKSLEQYINGPLRDELNEMKKYLHKH